MVKATLTAILIKCGASHIDLICDSICSFLVKHSIDSLTDMKQYNSNVADVFFNLMKIIAPHDFSKTGDIINNFFSNNVEVKTNFGRKFIENSLPWEKLAKICFLLLISISSFLMNFHYKHALNTAEAKNAENYAVKEGQKIIPSMNYNDHYII